MISQSVKYLSHVMFLSRDHFSFSIFRFKFSFGASAANSPPSPCSNTEPFFTGTYLSRNSFVSNSLYCPKFSNIIPCHTNSSFMDTRATQAPCYLHEYHVGISLLSRNVSLSNLESTGPTCITHPLSNVLSYAKQSPKHHAFTILF